jgi:hypothetical protein
MSTAKYHHSQHPLRLSTVWRGHAYSQQPDGRCADAVLRTCMALGALCMHMPRSLLACWGRNSLCFGSTRIRTAGRRIVIFVSNFPLKTTQDVSIPQVEAAERASAAFQSVFEKGAKIELDHYVVYFARKCSRLSLRCMSCDRFLLLS